jgi:anti-sigma regulatory factor (Ser/Thr protein kinase)
VCSKNRSITELQMRSSLQECARLRRLVARMAARSLCKNAALDMELAVGEALSNAVKYGSPDEMICVRIDLRAKHELAVDLYYCGNRFNTRVRRPAHPQTATHGYGRFIIRQVTDDMEYTFEDGRTHLRLTKRC